MRAAHDQLVKTIRRFTRRPGHSAQQQDAEIRVVKCPGIVAENTAKDPSLSALIGVEHRLRLGLVGVLADGFVGCRQHRDFAAVSLKRPISLIEQVDCFR